MVFNKKIGNNLYLHIIHNLGWNIDNNLYCTHNKINSNQIIRYYSKDDYYNHLNIYLSTKCNGKCKYCYQENHINKNISYLSIEEIKSFLDNLPPSKNKTKKVIELFGGEPLMHPNIKNIIRLIHSYGFHINIATNGTLPILKNEDFINLISKNTHIRISLDGHTKDLHEYNRTKGSFEKIINNILFLSQKKINLSIKTIITDHNFKYIKDILFFIKYHLKVKNWNYNVIYNLNNSKVFSTITHYDVIKELYKQDYLEYLPLMKQTPFTQFLINIFVKRHNKYRRTYIFLNYDNNLYLNDQLIFEEWKIGNNGILDKIFFEKIKKIEYERKSCKICFAKDYCFLGNYGELYDIDKTLEKEFPTCDILRKCVLHIMKNRKKSIIILKNIFNKI